MTGAYDRDASAAPSTYVPILALPYWDVIGAFVRDAVVDAARLTDRTERDLYAAATPFVLWCWQVRATELVTDRIFRRFLVQQFVHLGMDAYSVGSRATHRSALWRMVEVLNPTDVDDGHRSLGRVAAIAPYNDVELTRLYSWSRGQTTAHRRKDAAALLALGLGAGLATRELLAVRSDDVVIGETGTLVRVQAGRARVVPVLPEWRRTLAHAASDAEKGALLFRPGRQSGAEGQVTDFITRSRTTVDVRPSRMRSTWLLNHLANGTSARELLRISGLKNYAALDKIADFLQPDDMKKKH
jgi:integrase